MRNITDQQIPKKSRTIQFASETVGTGICGGDKVTILVAHALVQSAWLGVSAPGLLVWFPVNVHPRMKQVMAPPHGRHRWSSDSWL